MPVLLDDLQQQIANGQVVAVVGAGVSIGATGADTASWIGLLKDGIARCEGVGNPRPNPGWGDRQRAALDDGQLDELLSVASQIESRLGAPNGGEYRRWLRESVGMLRVKDRTTLEALRDLGVPLATTNYDGLIEDVTKLPAVTWRDGARIQRVIRGDEPGILHLHGYWEQPESVVLGIRSYDQVLGDAHAQTVLSALALVRSFLFIGGGEGLADPNFRAFLQWMQKVFPGAEYRHFRLCRDDEIERTQQQHPPRERIFALGYGATHAELASFLRRLKPTISLSPTRPEPDTPALLPPRPARIFGRDHLVEDLVTTLLLDAPPPVAVLGGPGFGKSTLCLAALHEPRVAARFGLRRWFVRCDSANTPDDMLKEIALIIGVAAGSSLGPRVFAALSEAPGVLVIDNAETPWSSAPLPTEELLIQLNEISGLALIAAIRGQQRPYGPAWREPSLSVTPLDLVDSRKIFLAIAGERLAADRHLSDLLAALDGIPLAIELLAHAAEAEPDLEGLWRRWQEERIALLRRADGSTRLANAAVSFELSIAGPWMTDEARQLLSVLAVPPDGIALQDLPAVMPDHPHRAAATLRRVGLAFDRAGRLRVLAPLREHVLTLHPSPHEALAPVLSHYPDLGQPRLKEIPRSKNLKTRVFISYSHQDRRWISRLQVHLKPIVASGLIVYWYDGEIDAGSKWREEIRLAIETAKIAILLVSADFLASEFISENELPPLLRAAETEGCHILPIIVGPCRFSKTPALAGFQAFNPESRPLIGMRRKDQEDLFLDVANTIEKILESDLATK